jgi:hypothetical protein
VKAVPTSKTNGQQRTGQRMAARRPASLFAIHHHKP